MSQSVETIAPPKPPEQIGRADGTRFDFERDSFAFANELLWEYRFDVGTGKTSFTKREPKPDYALRCFVLTRTVRQFFYHAEFVPDKLKLGDSEYVQRIREVVRRNPRRHCAPEERVSFPGFAGLRDFGQTHEKILKSECGGAWRSYVLRSHWRMVLPISRAHQDNTARRLLAEVTANRPPIVHVVLFPKLTINHGLVVFGAEKFSSGIRFSTYDPNDPEKPTTLTFDSASRTFSLPANRYWAGGNLDVIEIYRNWFFEIESTNEHG